MEALLVDDDDDLRLVHAIALQAGGFTVRQAVDGVAALHALKERSPDVLVLDLDLPALDGFGVMRALRQQGLGDNTRLAVVTARLNEESYLRSFELGAHAYLNKPIAPRRLAAAIADLVAATPEQLRLRCDDAMQQAALLSRMEMVMQPRADWDYRETGAP